MANQAIEPTTDPELNDVLGELVSSARAILGDNFIGAYLQGSFAVGEWDIHSDVDFLIAVEDEVAPDHLPALRALHRRLPELDSNWAKHLEGSYFPKALLRREDLALTPLLYVDNGSRELIRSVHDNTLVVRRVTRECGIILAGPDPRTLIDPVADDDLRREVLAVIEEWGQEILDDPERMNNLWYQPYAVISFCRMLQTLDTGRVESKPAGVRWGVAELESRWSDLIQDAWEQRPDPSLKVRMAADPAAVKRTRSFIRFAQAAARAYQARGRW